MFAAFLHALPTIVGVLLCLYALYGFWRGLSLRPHGQRAQQHEYWWWSAGN